MIINGSIFDAFINALLADATYALDEFTVNGLKGGALISKLSERMTPEVAKYIGDNYTVVTHIETDDTFGSGFDATVWENIATGKKYVSMQGTVGAGDFLTDVDLTLGNGAPARQVIDMVNWWLKISTPVGQQAPQIAAVIPDVPYIEINPASFITIFRSAAPVPGEGLVNPGETVTVNGHSLGGGLAGSFSRLFGGSAISIDDVNTFNSAGFNPFSEILFSQISLLIPYANGAISGRYNNFYAENGISATTREWFNIQYGSRIPLTQENSATIVPNHFMYKITDMLALGKTLEILDATFSVTQFNKVLENASNKSAASYEGVLDGLRRIFGTFDTSTPIGDAGDDVESRRNYHQNIIGLENNTNFKNMAGKVVISDKLFNTNPQQDYSHFLSLYYLTPFAIIGSESLLKTINPDLHTLWVADTALTAEEKSKGKANFSDSWYQDRVAMLAALNTINATDTEIDAGSNHTGGTIHYYDSTIGGAPLISESSVSDEEVRLVRFGNEVANDLTGGAYSDRLYGIDGKDKLNGLNGNDVLDGGAGDDELLGGEGADLLLGGNDKDLLDGGAGNDVLKGGEGNDTYKFTGDFGRDTVIDNEGLNTLDINGAVGELKQTAKDSIIYRNSANTVEAVVVDNGGSKTLLLNSLSNPGSSVTLDKWSDGQFGISLKDADAETPPSLPTISGDGAANALSADFASAYETLVYVPPVNLQGGDGHDYIEGSWGGDRIYGDDGNDWIDAGSAYKQSATIMPKAGDPTYDPHGKDLIEGGEGDDVITGRSASSTWYGGEGKDMLLANTALRFDFMFGSYQKRVSNYLSGV